MKLKAKVVLVDLTIAFLSYSIFLFVPIALISLFFFEPISVAYGFVVFWVFYISFGCIILTITGD